MFTMRLIKLLALAGFVAFVALAIGATYTTSVVNRSAGVVNRQVSSPADTGLPSAARVRSLIPSDFIQPIGPYDPGSEVVQPTGPRTLRDKIPSNFIQPVAPHNVRDEIPSEFIQPVAP